MLTTLIRIDKGEVTALKLGDQRLDVEDYLDESSYLFVINYSQLQLIDFSDLSNHETFEFYVTDFNELITGNKLPEPTLRIAYEKNKITLVLAFIAERLEWFNGPIEYDRYMTSLYKTLVKYGDEYKYMTVMPWGKYPNDLTAAISISKKFNSFAEILNYSKSRYEQVIKNTESRLRWSSVELNQYENEEIFTKEVIIPLFKELGFENVRYNGGRQEFGKDVICYKKNELEKREFWGIQVKNEDIKGSASSNLNTIINQIDDAFKIPFNSIETGNDEYISRLVIAVNGSFTDNAAEKIVSKIQSGVLKNNVFFLDKSQIESMIKNKFA